MTERKKKGDLSVTVITLAIIIPVLYFSFSFIDDWAAKAFAKPLMASALVTVLEVAVILVILCLMPSVSKLVAFIRVKKQ